MASLPTFTFYLPFTVPPEAAVEVEGSRRWEGRGWMRRRGERSSDGRFRIWKMERVFYEETLGGVQDLSGQLKISLKSVTFSRSAGETGKIFHDLKGQSGRQPAAPSEA